MQLLESAVQAGFTHFDTAPYYGFGWAERDLGELIQRHPKVTVTTKVGIYSPGGESAGETTVFLRKAAGRLVRSLSRPTVDFALARAQASLEASLVRLKTECIALYMLHEPDSVLVQTDEWQRWLEAEVARGRIQMFGLAVTREKLLPFLNAKTPLAPIIQMLDSLSEREADCLAAYRRPMQITYGYVTAARRMQPTQSVARILESALIRNANGAIIVSTTRIDRLTQFPKLLGKESA